MKKVTKEEFYKVMNPLNVHPRIVTDRYPYTQEWHLQDQITQTLVGKTVGRIEKPYNPVTDYYLVETDRGASWKTPAARKRANPSAFLL